MTEPNATLTSPIEAPSKDAPVPLPGLRRLPVSRVVMLCSGPLGIAVVVVMGMVVTHSFNWTGHEREMWAAAVISLVAGLLAVLPMLVWMGHGAIAIVRLTMVATVLRMMLLVLGLVLALGPGWKLSAAPLALWTAGCYVALLIAESSATAWVVRHG